MEKQVHRSEWVNATYDLIKTGASRGMLGIELEFLGPEPVDNEFPAQLIKKLCLRNSGNTKAPAPALIRLRGKFPSVAVMNVLVQCLKDYRFRLELVIGDGVPLFDWMRQVHWLILATSGEFVPILCNEVWYSPKVEEGEIPPRLTLPQPDLPVLFLQVGKLSLDDAEAFALASHPQVWRFL